MRTSTSVVVAAAALAALASSTLAAYPADRIESLPGLSTPLNFSQYAGYLMVDPAHQRQLFYWYTESQDVPTEQAPLVLWLNGGPGCSSVGGFWTENGPFILNKDLTLSRNPFAYNKVANMLWLEAPAGVGFSFSNVPSDYNTGDTQTANDNLQALVSFYAKFPELRSRDFYIAGESYAGHYIPELSAAILAYNNKQAPADRIPLKGFAAGNALTDEDIDFNSPMPYYRFHALISEKTFLNAVKACDGGRFAPCSGPSTHPCSAECNKYVSQAQQEIGNIDPYDVIGDVCLNEGQQRVETQAFRMAKHNPLISGGLDSKGKPLRNVFPVCVDVYSQMYLNQPAVKAAIHANMSITWVDCTSAINYKFSHKSMLPLYEQFFYTSDLRVVMYSGDADSILPFIGTQWNIDAMNRTVVEAWRPWTASDGQVGGYVTRYDKLDFVTIRAAGHLVPETQPRRALDFFTRFIYNKQY